MEPSHQSERRKNNLLARLQSLKTLNTAQNISHYGNRREGSRLTPPPSTKSLGTDLIPDNISLQSFFPPPTPLTFSAPVAQRQSRAASVSDKETARERKNHTRETPGMAECVSFILSSDLRIRLTSSPILWARVWRCQSSTPTHLPPPPLKQ